MQRIVRYYPSIAVLCATVPACAQPQEPAAGVGLTGGCIESIAAVALTNPRTNELAANYVGPLGLTPTSDPNAPPWRSKQVEFAFSDGTMHYLAIEGAAWTKAAIMRVGPTDSGPRLRVFVMDRGGTLLAAGVIENRRLTVRNIRDRDVQVDFRSEQAMWRLAGPDEACGPS